jgi:hypothetical protein
MELEAEHALQNPLPDERRAFSTITHTIGRAIIGRGRPFEERVFFSESHGQVSSPEDVVFKGAEPIVTVVWERRRWLTHPESKEVRDGRGKVLESRDEIYERFRTYRDDRELFPDPGYIPRRMKPQKQKPNLFKRAVAAIRP